MARSAAGHLAARACEPGVDTAFAWIGYLGDSGKYIVVGLAFYIVGLLGAARGWPNPLRVRYESMTRGSLLLLSTMAVGGLVVLLLKRGVARARPELYFEKGIYGMGEAFSRAQLFNSFPSSHTYAAFSVAVVLGIPALALGLPVAGRAGRRQPPGQSGPLPVRRDDRRRHRLRRGALAGAARAGQQVPMAAAHAVAVVATRLNRLTQPAAAAG